MCISDFAVEPTPPRTLVLHTSARNEPAAITPGFVARAIRRALALGWDPAHNSTSARLTYRNGDFRDFALIQVGENTCSSPSRSTDGTPGA